jgi:hypothetical protein
MSIIFGSSRNSLEVVGLEVLTAVVMKNSIFWDITRCGPLEFNRLFRGKRLLHLQCRRIRQEGHHGKSGSKKKIFL